ncbi:hypothetical protein KC19_11G102100 [Ceratodon purpureus]|uniref:Exostosin GT47 domain-containing protein n=1 Tax=Ceratodon purpureus TaxID=3225 RepID=A0A8T0GIZ2_CERPU|nr:hypothetical protein KC19_11G102100 [Ceratodon purpureus]
MPNRNPTDLVIKEGHSRSVFCLSPAGDTPSSACLFDAIVSGCIPVVVSDELDINLVNPFTLLKTIIILACCIG